MASSAASSRSQRAGSASRCRQLCKQLSLQLLALAGKMRRGPRSCRAMTRSGPSSRNHVPGLSHVILIESRPLTLKTFSTRITTMSCLEPSRRPHVPKFPVRPPHIPPTDTEAVTHMPTIMYVEPFGFSRRHFYSQWRAAHVGQRVDLWRPATPHSRPESRDTRSPPGKTGARYQGGRCHTRCHTLPLPLPLPCRHAPAHAATPERTRFVSCCRHRLPFDARTRGRVYMIEESADNGQNNARQSAADCPLAHQGKGVHD